MLVRQLEEELRLAKHQQRQPSVEMSSQLDHIATENEHLTRESAILRETIKVKTPVDILETLGWDFYSIHINLTYLGNNP